MKQLATIAGLLALAACNRGADKPELTAQQLMKDKVQPAAQAYWDAVRFVSDETGAHDIKPTTDAEWEKVRQAAADLQDYGRLLQTDAYTEGRNADWTKFSQAMVDISKQAEQAAIDKDPDKVFEVGGTMYNVCSACHMVYPATVGPEASETPQEA